MRERAAIVTARAEQLRERLQRDGWCERRALKPLRFILQAYPLASGLTDEWGQLHNALRDIRALNEDELNAREKERLNQAIVGAEKILGRR